MNFNRTNHDFVAASLAEYVRAWATGTDCSLRLETFNGRSSLSLNCTLGWRTWPGPAPGQPAAPWR
jgi:hypothetical protein